MSCCFQPQLIHGFTSVQSQAPRRLAEAADGASRPRHFAAPRKTGGPSLAELSSARGGRVTLRVRRDGLTGAEKAGEA